MAAIIIVSILVFIASILAILGSNKGSTFAVVVGFVLATPIIGGICLILRNNYFINVKLNKMLGVNDDSVNIFDLNEDNEWDFVLESEDKENEEDKED